MNYQAKRKKTLLLMIVIFILTIILSVLFGILKIKTDIKLMIIAIVLIIAMVFLVKLKASFDYYSYIYSLDTLINNSNKPIKITKALYTKSWFKLIEDNNYKLYSKNNLFSLYYRFVNIGKSKKTKSAVFLVVMHQDIDFHNDEITKSINSFENEFLRKERFYNYIILQFKHTVKLDQNNIKNANKVFFSKEGKYNYVVIINSLFSTSENLVYFLHSKNNYYPNIFYEFGVNEIKNLI